MRGNNSTRQTKTMVGHKRNGNVLLLQPERRKIDKKTGTELKKFTNSWKTERKSRWNI
jgi:hypothetical protein